MQSAFASQLWLEALALRRLNNRPVSRVKLSISASKAFLNLVVGCDFKNSRSHTVPSVCQTSIQVSPPATSSQPWIFHPHDLEA
jgi:hypothetical protein